MTEIRIRKYSQSGDTDKIFEIWSEVLQEWPISKGDLCEILKDNNCYIAEINSLTVGLVAIGIDTNSRCSQITLLMIDKKYQNQGIGTQLLNFIIDYFKSLKIVSIGLGIGSGKSYFWYGIPQDCVSGIRFFQKNKFKLKSYNYDMVLEFNEKYCTPKSILSKVGSKVEIRIADKDDIEDVLNFENINFPNWSKYFKKSIDNKRYDQVMLIKSAGKIIATTLLYLDDCMWRQKFNGVVGRGACLGVAANERGKNFGIILKSKGMEILQDKGAKYIWISWAGSVDFYKKLGFSVWKTYEYMEINL